MKILDIPVGYIAIDPGAIKAGDLILWYRGRVWREVIEVDIYSMRVVAKNSEWRTYKDGTITGASRSDAWHNVAAACRRS